MVELVELSCPKCFKEHTVPAEVVGKKVKCGCGHSFVATPPVAEAAPIVNFVATRPPVGHDGTEKVSDPKNKQTQEMPKSGPVACPFCDVIVSQNSKYLGQAVLCPACHANFNAPHWNAKAIQKEEAQRQDTQGCLNLLGGLVTVAGGIALVALARGCF